MPHFSAYRFSAHAPACWSQPHPRRAWLNLATGVAGAINGAERFGVYNTNQTIGTFLFQLLPLGAAWLIAPTLQNVLAAAVVAGRALFDSGVLLQLSGIHARPIALDMLAHLVFLGGSLWLASFVSGLALAIVAGAIVIAAYDVVISSSHAVAKGVLAGPDQIHIGHVHSLIRYAWDLQHQYLEQSKLASGPKSAFARLILPYIRNWDIRTSNPVDSFVANSGFIARRIKKVCQREAQMIFPLVDIDAFTLNEQKEDFYLIASRMTSEIRHPHHIGICSAWHP